MNRRNFIKRGALFVPAIFIPRLIRAQGILDAPDAALVANRKRRTGGGGGGGGSAYSLVAHTSAADDFLAVTSRLNSSGATSAIIIAGSNCPPCGSGDISVSDSKSNTWVAKTFYNSAANRNAIKGFYCLSPTVGASHTFSADGGGSRMTVTVLLFSGGTPAFDQASGLGSSGAGFTTIKPGALTPAASPAVAVTGVAAYNDGGTFTVDSSFTIIENITGANHQMHVAYKLLSSTSALDPQWTTTVLGDGASNLLVFK